MIKSRALLPVTIMQNIRKFCGSVFEKIPKNFKCWYLIPSNREIKKMKIGHRSSKSNIRPTFVPNF